MFLVSQPGFWPNLEMVTSHSVNEEFACTSLCLSIYLLSCPMNDILTSVFDRNRLHEILSAYCEVQESEVAYFNQMVKRQSAQIILHATSTM